MSDVTLPSSVTIHVDIQDYDGPSFSESVLVRDAIYAFMMLGVEVIVSNGDDKPFAKLVPLWAKTAEVC